MRYYKDGDRVVITKTGLTVKKGWVGREGVVISSHAHYFGDDIKYFIRFPRYKAKYWIETNCFEIDKKYYREKRLKKLLD